MIISTTNEKVADLLAPYGLRLPDDNQAFDMTPATVQQLDQLCTVMTAKYTGQWSVSFDGKPMPLDYAGLTENLDDEASQSFILSPMYIGADSEDLTYWLEEVYRQPVTMDDYRRVAQYFRFWYAANHPDEYQNPPSSPPTKYAMLSLMHPADGVAKNRRRADRLKNAANRLGRPTIDKLAADINAASDEAIIASIAALRES